MPATFQRLMDLMLTGLQGTELFTYLNDIVLYVNSFREHKIKFSKLVSFSKLAARLRDVKLKLQPDKCDFFVRRLTISVILLEMTRSDPTRRKWKTFHHPRTQKI